MGSPLNSLLVTKTKTTEQFERSVSYAELDSLTDSPEIQGVTDLTTNTNITENMTCGALNLEKLGEFDRSRSGRQLCQLGCERLNKFGFGWNVLHYHKGKLDVSRGFSNEEIGIVLDLMDMIVEQNDEYHGWRGEYRFDPEIVGPKFVKVNRCRSTRSVNRLLYINKKWMKGSTVIIGQHIYMLVHKSIRVKLLGLLIDFLDIEPHSKLGEPNVTPMFFSFQEGHTEEVCVDFPLMYLPQAESSNLLLNLRGKEVFASYEDQITLRKYSDGKYCDFDIYSMCGLHMVRFTYRPRLDYIYRTLRSRPQLIAGDIEPNSDVTVASGLTEGSGIQNSLPDVKHFANLLVQVVSAYYVANGNTTIKKMFAAIIGGLTLVPEKVSSVLLSCKVALKRIFDYFFGDNIDDDLDDSSGGELGSMSLDDFVNWVQNLVGDWESLKNSQLFKSLSYLVSALLAALSLPPDLFDINWRNITCLQFSTYRRQLSASNILSAIGDSIYYLLSGIQGFYETGSLLSVVTGQSHLDRLSSEVTLLYSKLPLYRVGDFEAIGMSSNEYHNKSSRARKYYTVINGMKIEVSERQRLAQIRKQLEEVEEVISCELAGSSARMKPFCTVFFGGSRIGKTHLTTLFLQEALAAGGYPHSNEYVCNYEMASAFADNLRVWHTGGILADLAQALPGTNNDKCVSNVFRSLVDNQMYCPEMAALELKNRNYVMWKACVGNTNVPHLNAPYEVHEPAAVLSRIDIMWQVVVRPEYQLKVNGYHTGMIDPQKFAEAMDGGRNPTPDLWYFTPLVCRLLPTEPHPPLYTLDTRALAHHKGSQYAYFRFKDPNTGLFIQNLNIVDALKFNRHMAKSHYEKQEVALKSSQAEWGRCDNCGMLCGMCECEVAEPNEGSFPQLRSIRLDRPEDFNYPPSDQYDDDGNLLSRTIDEVGRGGIEADFATYEAFLDPQHRIDHWYSEERSNQSNDSEPTEIHCGFDEFVNRYWAPSDHSVVDPDPEIFSEAGYEDRDGEDGSSMDQSALHQQFASDMQLGIEPNGVFNKRFNDPEEFFRRYKNDRVEALKTFFGDLDLTLKGELAYLGRFCVELVLEMISKSSLWSYKTIVPVSLRNSALDHSWHWLYDGGKDAFLKRVLTSNIGFGLVSISSLTNSWRYVGIGGIFLLIKEAWRFAPNKKKVYSQVVLHKDLLHKLSCSVMVLSCILVICTLKSVQFLGEVDEIKIALGMLAVFICTFFVSSLTSALMLMIKDVEETYERLDSEHGPTGTNTLNTISKTVTAGAMVVLVSKIVSYTREAYQNSIVPQAFGEHQRNWTPIGRMSNDVPICYKHNELCNRIRKNVVYVTSDQIKINTSVLVVKSNCYLIPRHAHEKIPDRTILNFIRMGESDNVTCRFRIIYDKKAAVNLPNTDLTLVPFTGMKSIGTFKDITNCFVENEPSSGPARMVIKNPDGFVEYKEIKQFNFAKDLTNKAPDFDSKSWWSKDVRFDGLEYVSEGYPGLCMSPIVDYNSRSGIIGVHLGGPVNSTRENPIVGRCVAGYIKRSKLISVIHELEGDVRLEHTDCADPLRDMPLNLVRPKTDKSLIANSSVEVNHLTGITLTRKEKNIYKPTRYAEDIYNKFPNYNCKFNGPKFAGEDGLDFKFPYKVGLESISHMCPGFPNQLLNKAVDNYAEKFMSLPEFEKVNFQPLTYHQAINGDPDIPYVDKMDMSTSAGYCPYADKVLGPKSRHYDEETKLFNASVMKRVDDFEDKYREGILGRPIFWTFVKNEAHRSDKCKARLIQCVELAFSVIVRKYFGRFISYVQVNTTQSECAVGVNAQGRDWSKVFDYLTNTSNDRIMAGDFKRFDLSNSNHIAAVVANWVEKMFVANGVDPVDAKIAKMIIWDIYNPVVVMDGDCFEIFGTTPSGHNLTSVLNSIYISILNRMYFIELNPRLNFNHHVSLATYGDDFLAAVSKHCVSGLRGFQKFLAQFSMVLTDSSKSAVSCDFQTIWQVDFLKRTFRYDMGFKRIVGPLHLDSIMKRLLVSKKDDDEVLAHNLAGALVEFSFYGEVSYNNARDALLDVAECHGIKFLMPDFVNKDFSDFTVWWDSDEDKEEKKKFIIKD